MKAVAYLRKSTSGKDEDGSERQEGSFERQKMSIEDFAKRKDIEITRWYEEPMSGKSIRRRKVFLRMVKDAKNPTRQFEAIIFDDYSRFMRDIKEAQRYEVELDDFGIKLLFTNLPNDDSISNEIYKSIARTSAADYSRDLARKVLQGMIRKANKGCWLGGIAPYGYRTFKDGEGNTWLVIYEPEAVIVRKIFDLSLKGWGHRSIARWLNGQGIKASETAQKRNSLMNKNLDGKWSGESVRGLLRNSVYKGVSKWNKRARVDCFDWALEGKGTVNIKKLRTENHQFLKNGDCFGQRSRREFFIDRAKPREEWIVIEGKVPCIIDPKQFDAAQERFKKYATDKSKKANTAKALMTGSLYCMVCGGNRFQAHSTSKMIKSKGEKTHYHFYRCSGDVRKGSHAGLPNNLILSRPVIDRVVSEGLCARIDAFVRPEKVFELFEAKLRVFLGNNPNYLAQVENEIEKVRGEQKRMIYAHQKFGTPIPDDTARDLKEQLEFLQGKRDSLLAAGHGNIRQETREAAKRFIMRIKEAKVNMAMKDTQEILHIRQAFLPKAEVS